MFVVAISLIVLALKTKAFPGFSDECIEEH